MIPQMHLFPYANKLLVRYCRTLSNLFNKITFYQEITMTCAVGIISEYHVLNVAFCFLAVALTACW
jgi:hypothetical protein